MGVPYFQIKDIVKDKEITVFSSNFTLYRDISARVIRVLKEEFALVEQYSIDEVFFTITGTHEEVEENLRRVKIRVEQLVGVPVSLGVGATKTQAKYAVEVAKKTGGVHVLNHADWLQRASTIAVHEIWGVGRKTSAKLTTAGISTVTDILRCESRFLDRLLGIVGLRLQAELRGESMYPVSAMALPHKSHVSSRSFKAVTTDVSVVADAVAYHTRMVASALRQSHQKALVIRVTLLPNRHGDWFLHGVSKEAVLAAPSHDTLELITVAQSLCTQAFTPGVPYQKVAVSVGLVVSDAVQQPDLFSTQETASRARLLTIIDAVNKKSGKETVVVGSYLRTPIWQSKREHVSPAYTTKWTDVAVAKARP